MKSIILSLFSFLSFIMVSGQEAEPINFQAIMRNAAGEVVATKPVSIKFSIIKESPSGIIVYSENHRVTTNQGGLISLLIGSGTDKTGNFATIDWNADSYFLKVETDPAGGTSFKEMSTTQLITVPDAKQSNAFEKSSSLPDENELFIIRKFVGSYLDYRYTGPETYGGPNIIWIKTSMDKTYGKFSAYGRKCDFSVGDNLYLKRSYYNPGVVTGYWIYQIENDSSIFYRLTDFQHDKEVMVETLFH
jgi:hypothetical protein